MINGVSNLSRMLAEMERMKVQAGTTPAAPLAQPQGVAGAQPVSFGDVMKNAVGSVNNLQANANQLARAFEMGDSRVDITQVMIASQKASIGFQGMTQVRNKLVDAYKEIMNMPV